MCDQFLKIPAINNTNLHTHLNHFIDMAAQQIVVVTKHDMIGQKRNELIILTIVQEIHNHSLNDAGLMLKTITNLLFL